MYRAISKKMASPARTMVALYKARTWNPQIRSLMLYPL
jgi:hypothetical protein